MKTKSIEAKENNGFSQARRQLESIVEMVKALKLTDQGDDENARDEARAVIHEDPLSVEVRGDWHTLDAPNSKPTHFRILLAWGGPACQIIGDLSAHQEPETAEIQGQDWGTPWETLRGLTDEEDQALLAYSREFYFGQ